MVCSCFMVSKLFGTWEFINHNALTAVLYPLHAVGLVWLHPAGRCLHDGSHHIPHWRDIRLECLLHQWTSCWPTDPVPQVTVMCSLARYDSSCTFIALNCCVCCTYQFCHCSVSLSFHWLYDDLHHSGMGKQYFKDRSHVYEHESIQYTLL